MNRLLIISILSAAFMTSCGHSGPDGQGSSREAEVRDHGAELHDHESEGHDHVSENHTGHDHEEKRARSCRRNRVYARTGSAYRFRAADRRARPVPRRDRDKRPDSGSARRRGRRSGARQRHRLVRGQETLGRSGRIPGRDPFHHLVEGNRRRRLRATHPLGIHAGGNRFPASRKADRRPNHHADRIRASPAGIRKRQDGLRCARKQIVGQGNPRHGPHRRLHQEPVGRRRRLRHGRPIACNRFAKPQARTESGSVAEIRRQTARRDERQFRNALRRPRLLARRDGRTSAVGR